jgi:hypothetical protein
MEAPRRAYALRHTHIRRGFRVTGDGSSAASAVAQSPAAVATVAVGLQPFEMTKQERQLFGNRMKDYLRARCGVRVRRLAQRAATCTAAAS